MPIYYCRCCFPKLILVPFPLFFFFLNTDPRPYHPLLAPYHFIVLTTWSWSLSLSSCFRAHWWQGVWDSEREGKGNINLRLTIPVPAHFTNHSFIYPFLSSLFIFLGCYSFRSSLHKNFILISHNARASLLLLVIILTPSAGLVSGYTLFPPSWAISSYKCIILDVTEGTRVGRSYKECRTRRKES